MKKYRDQWHDMIATALQELAAETNVSGLDTTPLVVETPPKPELGDFAFPLFPFARVFRKAPPAIAAEVAARLSAMPGSRGIGTVAAAGPYVNVKLTPAPVIDDVLAAIAAQGPAYGRSAALSGQRVMLEFSCPNTNKPLHLGHLRNDALGESLSRMLAAAGATLRKVNLINDRGVHICKSMLAYRLFGAGATPASEGVKGDHFVGSYYVKYAQHAKDHPEAEEEVRQMLRKWEEGDPEVVALWKTMNAWVMEGISQSYKRTGHLLRPGLL